MAKYLILALNSPTDGNEDAFNDWYDTVHVPELLAVPGITSARRFKVIQSNLPFQYAAAYEIETDDFAATMQAMASGMGPFPDAFDKENSRSVVAMALPA